MKTLLSLAAAAALLVGLVGVARAADELPHSGRILVAISGDIEVGADEQADAVIVIDGTARVEGTVNALVVIEGQAVIDGATLESIAIVNGTADLGAGTTVLDDVNEFNSTVERADDVEIGGSVRDMTGDLAAFGLFIGAAAIVLWLGLGIATLLVGLLVAGLAARQVRIATALISREPVNTALVGLLGMVVPPILAVLLALTIIGIPAAIGLLIVVWPAVAFVGYIVAAIWLGEWLLGRRSPAAAPAERPYTAALLGLVVAFVIGFVPLATAILSILGLGAVVLAAWRTLRGGGAPRPVVPQQQQPTPVG
jgi:hypothetical protein